MTEDIRKTCIRAGYKCVMTMIQNGRSFKHMEDQMEQAVDEIYNAILNAELYEVHIALGGSEDGEA